LSIFLPDIFLLSAIQQKNVGQQNDLRLSESLVDVVLTRKFSLEQNRSFLVRRTALWVKQYPFGNQATALGNVPLASFEVCVYASGTPARPKRLATCAS
jgi:hypothetical protein